MIDKEKDPKSEKEKEYSFYVDATQYFTDSKTLTGAQIKEQAGVTPGYQLFLEEDGDEPDTAISDGGEVHLKKGKNAQRFYAVPPATFGAAA